VAGYIPRWYALDYGTHLSTNWALHKAKSLMLVGYLDLNDTFSSNSSYRAYKITLRGCTDVEHWVIIGLHQKHP